MKGYTDLFGKALTKDDVSMAVMVVVRSGNPYPSNLSRKMRVGYAKARALTKVLCDAGVITSPDKDKPKVVILKNENQAINAALRQLRKGRK